MMNLLPQAYPETGLRGVIKQYPMDFQVTEVLGWEPSGVGEHVYLWIRKQNCNTHDVALKLAKCAKVPLHHVGYAGRKDKHAVTSQWFSVYLQKNPEPDWHVVENDNIEIHTITRGDKKCRLGVHVGNQFNLTIREIDLTFCDWEARLQQIQLFGFPNYFATQRFGIDENNIALARQFFADPKQVRSRFLQSTALSAARSYLFNAILAERIKANTWQTILPGDVVMFKDGHSVFCAGDHDTNRMDVAPCASMFGAGNELQAATPFEIEASVLANYPDLCQGLLKHELKRQWRALAAIAHDFTWFKQNDHCLCLSFQLQRGVYATALLREIFTVLHPRDFAAGVSTDVSCLLES